MKTLKELLNELAFQLDPEARVGTAEATSSSTTVVDDVLDEPDGFWDNGYVLITDGTNITEERKIISFVNSSTTLTTAAFTAAIDATSQYLVMRDFRPEMMIRAINRAISSSWPQFWETVVERHKYLVDESVSEYQLPLDVEKVFSIRLQHPTTGMPASILSDWRHIKGDGTNLIALDGWYAPTGNVLEIVYACRPRGLTLAEPDYAGHVGTVIAALDVDADYLWGQSFTTDGAIMIYGLGALLRKNGTTGTDVTLALYSDSTGSPNASLGSVTIEEEDITEDEMQWYYADLTTPIALARTTMFHFVASAGDPAANTSYQIGADPSVSYSRGSLKYNTGSWAANVDYDLYFKLLGRQVSTKQLSTPVDEDFIYAAAQAYLWSTKMSRGAGKDREDAQWNARWFTQEAERLRKQRSFRSPAIPINRRTGSYYQWRSRYPYIRRSLGLA